LNPSTLILVLADHSAHRCGGDRGESRSAGARTDLPIPIPPMVGSWSRAFILVLAADHSADRPLARRGKQRSHAPSTAGEYCTAPAFMTP
jgi:hypothetical protein